MPNGPSRREEAGPPVCPELDPLLERRSRLGICVLLSRYRALSFSRLKGILGETDGNLGAHLQKLEAGGYVTVRKEFVDRKPVSWYSLSRKGKTALRRHVQALGELIRGVET